MPCPKDFSRVDANGRTRAGSQRHIQTYVNERTEALNFAVAESLSRYHLDKKDIHWVSPLASDMYSEYQDAEFLERVGFGLTSARLAEFWPPRGPCWDALAQIDGGCLLVEAKSHVPEIYGGGCGASADVSRRKILAALGATKEWLGVSPEVDWTGPLYQSANRYAYLYFLREVVGVQAFLVNVYFVDDPRTRTTRIEWLTAIGCVNRELGLSREAP